MGYRASDRWSKAWLDKQLGAQGIKIAHKDVLESNTRPVVAASLGPHLLQSLLPHADPSDPRTLADGLARRMGKPLPGYNKKFLKFLSEEVRRFIRERGITPLPYDSPLDVKTWIERTNYEAWRKAELLETYEEVKNLYERKPDGSFVHFLVKLFMKDEHYVDWKPARGIYARDDVAKLAFGPGFKLMEDVLYKQPEFIKHVPARQRAKYVAEHVQRPGARYIATDYSAFERHFTAELMRHLEFVFYKHLLSSVEGGQEVLDCMEEVLTGTNRIVNKFFRANIDARRMSGEMNTSLGNGLSNLIICRAVCRWYGIGDVSGVVEGDDGLFSFVGSCPTTEHFTSLGFDIKLEEFDSIEKAGFCGQLFDMSDYNILTDPYKVFSMFGWTTAKYRNSNRKKMRTLIRAKSLSLAYQYPGCPLLGALAQYGMRITRGYDIRSYIGSRDIDQYTRDKLKEALQYSKENDLYKEPSLGARLMFEELYHIPVSTQLIIESYLNDKKDEGPLDLPLISCFVPPSWSDYYRDYVVTAEDGKDIAWHMQEIT